MKRLLTFFAAITVFIIAAIPAFADMDGPSYPRYTVYVTNKNGANFYQMNYEDDVFEETEYVIPVGEEVEINGEYYFNGEYYGVTTYNQNFGYIKLDDVSDDRAEIPVEDAYELEKPETVVVINPDGVYLRSAPSMTGEIVSGKIDFGTVITYSMGSNEYFPAWSYVTHNGESGWLYTVQYGFDNIYNCANIVSDDPEDEYFRSGRIMTVTDGLQLTKNPNPESEKNSEKIPAGTELEFEWYFSFAKSEAVYVEYKGVKGWLYTGYDFETQASYYSENEVLVNPNGEKIYLYDFPNGEKTDICISEKAFLKYDYSATQTEYVEDDLIYHEWFRVTVDGKIGWLLSSSDKNTEFFNVYSYENGTIYTLKEKVLYSEADKSAATDVIIPADIEIPFEKELNISKYDEEINEYIVNDNWCYVEFNGKKGWILTDCVEEKEETIITSYSDEPNIMYIEAASVYEYYSESSEIISEITEDTAVDVKYIYLGNHGDSSFYRVEYNGIKGWVKEENILYKDEFKEKVWQREENKHLQEDEFNVVFKNLLKEITAAEEETETETQEAQLASVSPNTIIIGCIAGAVILGLTAVVVVILINKKKKSVE